MFRSAERTASSGEAGSSFRIPAPAVSSARIAALLGRLEDKGYITRGPDPLNNRQVIVTLSPKGLEVIQSFRAQVLRSTAQMLSLLGPEDAKEFIRLRRKLLDNLTQQ